VDLGVLVLRYSTGAVLDVGAEGGVHSDVRALEPVGPRRNLHQGGRIRYDLSPLLKPQARPLVIPLHLARAARPDVKAVAGFALGSHAALFDGQHWPSLVFAKNHGDTIAMYVLPLSLLT
jgi:hypothetical protein